MFNTNLIKNFFEGKIKLWKSFWIVGFGHQVLLFYLIPVFEKIIFNNSDIYGYIQFSQDAFQIPDFTRISFLTKLIVILSTIYVTIGIWRSSENYIGSFFWIIVTFIYLSFFNIIPIIVLTFNLFI